MKRTLLDDFIKIYYSINCDSEYCSCNECSNKYIGQFHLSRKNIVMIVKILNHVKQ